MRLIAKNSAQSISDVGDELSPLFSQMLNTPQQSKNSIIQSLASTRNIKETTDVFPTVFKIASLKSQHKQQAQYIRLFPNVFIRLSVKTRFVASWQAKLMLKWGNLPFAVDDENLLHLKTVSYTSVSLFLQMLIYQSENEIIETSDLTLAKPSSTAVCLTHHLGVSYSQGQFLDFVDRLYDQYKHTKLSPYTFRHLFRCFGSYMPTIANDAFDHYIQLRNTEKAWQLAVSNFMQTQLSLPKPISQSVAKLLISPLSCG